MEPIVVKIIVAVHVFAGVSSLIAGACAMLLKTNTPKHRIAGKIYFWNMSYIFVSGLFLSIYRESLFFIFISFFVYHMLITAYRSLKLKNLHKEQKPSNIDYVIDVVAGLANLGFVVYGIKNYLNGAGVDAAIPIVFGLIGLRNVYLNARKFFVKPTDPSLWLKNHIAGMIGSYIGAITAFLVNQAEHIPLPNVVLWLGPTLILVPFIILELKKLKPKFSVRY